MSDQQWLERVRAGAVRRGLPPEYAARLVEELRAHAEDAAADPRGNAPAAARLGDPDAVVAAAVAAYRADSVGGRHPVLAFLVAPAVAFLFAAALYTVVGDCALAALAGLVGGSGHAVVFAATVGVAWLTGFVTPLLLVWVAWRAYRRSGRPRWWYYAASGAVVVLSAFLVGEFNPPTATADAEVFFELTSSFSPLQLVQLLLALGFAAGVARRSPCGLRPHDALA